MVLLGYCVVSKCGGVPDESGSLLSEAEVSTLILFLFTYLTFRFYSNGF